MCSQDHTETLAERLGGNAQKIEISAYGRIHSAAYDSSRAHSQLQCLEIAAAAQQGWHVHFVHMNTLTM